MKSIDLLKVIWHSFLLLLGLRTQQSIEASQLSLGGGKIKPSKTYESKQGKRGEGSPAGSKSRFSPEHEKVEKDEFESLTLFQLISVILFLLAFIYAFIAPLVIQVEYRSPLKVDINKIYYPFETYKHILGTDAYGRDLLDLFMIGLHKTFGAGLIMLLLNCFIISPLVLAWAYFSKPQSFLHKLLEPLLLFPAVFLYIIIISFSTANVFTVYLAVFLSSVIFVFYNLYRDVVQLLSLPMVETLKLNGASFKNIFVIVFMPCLIPNFTRLMRRTLVLVVSELIAIGLVHLNINQLSANWGTLIYQAWLHSDKNPYALGTLTILVSFILYISSLFFTIVQRFVQQTITIYRDLQRLNRAERYTKSAMDSQFEEESLYSQVLRK